MRKFTLFLLIVLILISCKSKPEAIAEAEEAMIEKIEILEPQFEVVSIVILQADLINTQFETIIKIDNPNSFSIDLSSINYELYGNGAFWSSGKREDVLHIPALSSSETGFLFSMNFIDMSRKLLDDIIAMRDVNYRFAGDVEVGVSLPDIPPFRMKFERSGYSEVKQRVEKKK